MHAMADATTTACTTRPGAADEGATAGAAKCKSVGCYTINFGETDAASGSLQSAFAKYRQEKAKALELRAGPAKRERSDDEKQALREKFLARCRHYLGVVSSRPGDLGAPCDGALGQRARGDAWGGGVETERGSRRRWDSVRAEHIPGRVSWLPPDVHCHSAAVQEALL